MVHWCPVCCSRHKTVAYCRGELLLTAAEFPGWKVNVETPRGLLAFGVLLAEAGDRWRARILTHPNVLWIVPGGSGTMKFVGKTRDRVEQQAVAFIREHCAERGYTMRDQVQMMSGSSFALDPCVLDDRAPRYKRILPVRYGVTKPTLFGRTGNLSETGLFVHTELPIPEGGNAGLMLELEHCRLPLRGAVVWSRSTPGPSTPVGMGMRLLRPPEIYLKYVQSLGLSLDDDALQAGGASGRN